MSLLVHAVVLETWGIYCGDLAELLFLDLKPHFVAAACWSAVPSLSVHLLVGPLRSACNSLCNTRQLDDVA